MLVVLGAIAVAALAAVARDVSAARRRKASEDDAAHGRHSPHG